MRSPVLCSLAVLLLPLSARADADLSSLVNVARYEQARGELQDKLYPIGFSPAGLFAYLSVSVLDGKGCYAWRFCVVNLRDDAVVAELSWESPDLSDGGDIADLARLYGDRVTQVEAALASHEVTRATPIRLGPFPHHAAADTIEARVVRGEPRDVEGVSETECRVVMRSSARGLKTIGRLVEAVMGVPQTYATHVLGYLPSPHSSRVVVVVEQERRGWEGPPHSSTFHLFGASLKAGFRAPTEFGWQSAIAAKPAKNVLDYFLLLPSSYLDCENVRRGFPTEESRRELASHVNVRNGYIGFARNAQVALFKDRENGIDIVALQMGRCGAGSTCEPHNQLLQYQGAQKGWVVRDDLVPEGYTFEELYEEYMDDDEKCPYYHLPEVGLTIEVRDEFTGSTFARLKWTGTRLNVVSAD